MSAHQVSCACADRLMIFLVNFRIVWRLDHFVIRSSNATQPDAECDRPFQASGFRALVPCVDKCGGGNAIGAGFVAGIGDRLCA